MTFADFRACIQAPALQAIVAHWHDARGTATMPGWEQLKPSRIAPHLSILWVYKYDRAAGRFVGRLAGNKIALAMEKNFRGIALEELWPADIAERSHQHMSRVVCEPVLYRNAGALFRHAGRVIEGERIMLPLAGDGLHGDGLLGASAYQYPLVNLNNLNPGPVELIADATEWFSLDHPAPAAQTVRAG